MLIINRIYRSSRLSYSTTLIHWSQWTLGMFDACITILPGVWSRREHPCADHATATGQSWDHLEISWRATPVLIYFNGLCHYNLSIWEYFSLWKTPLMTGLIWQNRSTIDSAWFLDSMCFFCKNAPNLRNSSSRKVAQAQFENLIARKLLLWSRKDGARVSRTGESFPFSFDWSFEHCIP